MHVRIGYSIKYDCPQPTPMILTLNVHYSRAADIVVPDSVKTDPEVPIETYLDTFGNLCARIVAPTGQIDLSADGVVRCPDQADTVDWAAPQIPVEKLPSQTLLFLLGSRYCETDLLSQAAWDLFGGTSPGWSRVQSICDYVHQLLKFDYEQASPTKSALTAFNERAGVCRDFTHLAIAFCRAMNIPARYCTGYIGDIGVPPPHEPMDFSAWMEVFLGGEWHVFDPRNNKPRIGRILVARGRDAADVALTSAFGQHQLVGFRVWADEVTDPFQLEIRK